MRRVLLVSAIVVGIVIAAGAGLFGYCAYNALKKEERYATILKVMDLCTEYVESTSGEWPRSWRDLENSSPDMNWEFAREICTIDFSASATTIAAMDVDDFDAVYPRKPTFKPESRIRELIKTCEEYTR